jgi:hypothetical protein
LPLGPRGRKGPDYIRKRHGLCQSNQVNTFEGAGHGFMGNQAGAGAANPKAAVVAWPLALLVLLEEPQVG